MDIVARVKAIIISPAQEWQTIESESGDIAGLYKNYVAILSAIPPVCMFIGFLLFGLGGRLVNSIVTYVLGLVFVYVMALIVDALAPTFSGRKDSWAAFKLVAYSLTPTWVVGVFWLVPPLGVLTVLGLYSIYVFYVGVPVMMKAPKEQALIYTVAAGVCWIVLGLAIFWIAPLVRGY